MKKWLSISLLTMLICSSSMAEQKIAPSTLITPTSMPLLEFSDPSKVITLTAQQPFFILHLKSNPTTGYTWFIKTIDHQRLKVLEKRYIAPEKNLIGAAGYEEWKITATPAALRKPALSIIKFIYARPWEHKPIQEVTFKVSIK